MTGATVPAPPLPLAGLTRELRVGLDAGTWISLDATPDGRTLVFDLLGGLWTIPVAGGRATPLTEGVPYDSQPRVSPDGRWVAFVSDRDGADNLWVLDLREGTSRQLSHRRHSIPISPAWSPDGARVLVAECLSYRSEAMLRWYRLAGGPVEDVVDADGRPVHGTGGVASPDGRHLYFSRRDPVDRLRFLMPVAQLWRLDLRTGRAEPLTEGRGGGVRPLLSPDGGLLAYATRHERGTALRIRDLRSGADRPLVGSVERDRQDYGRALRGDQLPGYAFTPDGRALHLSHGGRIHRVDVADATSWIVPFHADATLRVGPDLHRSHRVDQGPVRARIVQDPAWSPDGRRVAFSALTRLHVLDLGAPEPRRVTRSEEAERQPAWSPDGRLIAYVAWSPGRRGHVWLVPADGGPPRRLTSVPAFYTDPAFSPDGAGVVALRGLGLGIPAGELPRSLDLVWLPLDGGEARVIAADHRGRHPHFGPDPGRIFTTDGHTLLSVRVDGTDELTHLLIAGRFDAEENDQPAAERILVGPDGRQALALVDKQLWLLPVPPPAAGPPVVDLRAGHPLARRLTEVGADYFGWAPDGGVLWAIGSTVYRSPADGSDGSDRADGAAAGADAAAGVERDPRTQAIPVAVVAPRATPTGSLVLSGARVVTMARGRGLGIVEPADVVVERNRIAAVGPTGSVAVPSDARWVDVSGRVVLPGLIDTHAHWSFPTPEVADPDSWSLRANLAYGVTAGLDVQSDHVANFVYQDLVDAGRIVGPRAFMVGPGVFGVNDYKPYEADFSSYRETLAYLRRYAEHYRVHVVKAYLSGNRRQRQWIVLACRELGLMATTEGSGDRVLHVTHALDGMHGTEHAITDAEIHDDVVQVIARTRATHTSTLTITHYGVPGVEHFLSRVDLREDPKLNRFYPRDVLLALTGRRRVWAHPAELSIVPMAAQAAKIQRAGGLVGVGSHGEVQGLGYHWEMEMLAMGGMTPAEILTAATRDGARVIGLEADLGSIEPGKLADLVVLDADPLTDIRHTQRLALVMKDGVLYDAETLALV